MISVPLRWPTRGWPGPLAAAANLQPDCWILPLPQRPTVIKEAMVGSVRASGPTASSLPPWFSRSGRLLKPRALD